jgi:putative FmdB family regulatory protein
MPTYEYACMECGEKTDVFASIAEKEKGLKVTCPGCGGNKMVQFFGRVNVMGSARGSGGAPFCGPQSGPGCCG